MAYTSFGTRKALGRRYSQDPALLLEAERLQREYGLAPAREARALQAEQFNKSLAQQQSQFDETQAGNKMAGITGTVANLAGTGAVIRGLTKGKDEPFFGNWGNKTSTPTPSPAVAEYTQTTGGMSNPSGTPFGSPEEAFGMSTINPATIDATTSGIAAGADVGMGAGAIPAATPSTFSSLAVPGGQALGLYEGSRMAGDQFKEDTVANRILKDPITGWNGELVRGLGKVTGIKEFNKVADTMNQVEKDFIQKPIDAVTNFVSNIVSNLFSW